MRVTKTKRRFQPRFPRKIWEERSQHPAKWILATHQLSEGGQTVFFKSLDLYHKSLDSGELQYKSRN